ncbi:TPA: phage baseplate plug family protein [Raoultella planticola]|uniref:phage baseplate plug family protein n=1 Tax=Klebsiella michiganensis TaxID=1134687 RepID=UPI00387EBE5A
MTVSEIPLSPDNQIFAITLAGQNFQMSITWRAAFWCLDIMDSSGADLIKGIPLITGADLLAQYYYLGLGFSLYVGCDNPVNENPTQTDLGISSHLYVVTE